jgi:membrane-bound lytic murein transglycosylase D
MVLKSKLIKVIGLTVVLLGIGLLFMRYSNPETAKRQAEFEQYYRIYSLAIPDRLVFAGEPVPIDDIDVKERYDKELLVNVYWQSQTVLMIKRANRFFPVIEKILKQHNIPPDFKYLAVAESGLQNVSSPAGAVGYWQFLEKTGKMYGLEITEEVDERLNIERSTEAACRYFAEAYRIFGSWALVAASYNMGIDGVKKQLEQQKVSSYYDLYLNTETSRYVLRTLALKEIMERPESFGFNVAQWHLYPEIATREVRIDRTIDDLASFALENGANYKILKLFNPWLKKSQITVPPGKFYTIRLPRDVSSTGKISVPKENSIPIHPIEK